ncbi:hypothetical protein TVAG_503850 [Trichomonas vaginalis G3]|uniref:Uncharacterized protein n=1 Tax=Trichomonas vaginalis (strain ATCC PRA-98 / G3) TaxID=412133 RepID=A2GTJ8_TRIV3|nr:hypothetical protein TVAGG3_0843380 [Trichomonas vaginalis G3]EAX79520.1 hypothetical protein TVAG_503850 [Trichomonas vaginalis G3]KAI5499426.1 hypothetical protein TVAGG3_0843380 [Trichomonas vaginalis G3]|eukprot:XP_001292450.1 hypothetical protein [Trichomonas vaginalis G3]
MSQGLDIEAIKKEIREQILTELKTSKTGPSVLAQSAEEKPVKPKRKLSEKQLAALAAGREKNPRMKAKREREAKEKAEKEKAEEAH